MVVCKCRKATKLYCFVHKAPVCGECICFTEHHICVVRTYSEWVIDGEYDWPPTCCLCQAVLEDGSDSQTTRLGCLHVIHTNCLVSYLRSFPPHTAPAGYVCPTCSTPIWPPKSIKDSGSCLHSKLKEAIMQTGLDKNLFGNQPVPLPTSEPHNTPSASSSAAQEGRYMTESYSPATGIGSSNLSAIDIVEIEDPSSAGDQLISNHGPNFVKSTSPAGTGATTRKGAYHVDRQNSEISYFSDDVYGTSKKYTRRGPFSRKFLRALIPFWSSALPTLPITAPPRKDMSNTVDVSEGRLRHHQRSSRMDPRKILLVIAIMACMATMGILYYRLAQRSLGENRPDDEQQ